MTRSPEIIRLQDVARGYSEASGFHLALRTANLKVAEGEFLAITGPSGAGKTTLLHLAALLDRPTAGKIWFEGREVSSLPESAVCEIRKRKIAMIFQNYILLPHRSVLENVLFRFRYMEVDRAEARDLAEQAIAKMGLQELAGRTAWRLSAGEMQRVAIARAIVFPPRLLAADEPTGNLDRASTSVIMDSLRDLNRSGITILMVTHNEDLLAYTTRHIICRDGVVKE